MASEVDDSQHFAGFQWDEGNSAKCQSHGMTLAEVESLFSGDPLVGPDPFDPLVERRWRIVNTAESGRPGFAVFTVRNVQGERFIRVISARYMHAKEVRKYEQARQ